MGLTNTGRLRRGFVSHGLQPHNGQLPLLPCTPPIPTAAHYFVRTQHSHIAANQKIHPTT